MAMSRRKPGRNMGTCNCWCISRRKNKSKVNEQVFFFNQTPLFTLKVSSKNNPLPHANIFKMYFLALAHEEVFPCQVTGSKEFWHLQKTNNLRLAFIWGGQSAA